MKIKMKIKEIREDKNITIEQLSKETGISTEELTSIEEGNINTAFSNIAKIAYILDVKVEELYNEERD